MIPFRWMNRPGATLGLNDPLYKADFPWPGPSHASSDARQFKGREAILAHADYHRRKHAGTMEDGMKKRFREHIMTHRLPSLVAGHLRRTMPPIRSDEF
jgi:hypothetical protein